MTEPVVARNRGNARRTQVKTGCTTCRIRRVKCDENKPSCRRCEDTGRTCDGYQSPFRLHTSQIVNKARAPDPSVPIVPSVRTTSQEIISHNVGLLNRYFHTKTMFNVDLTCEEEARQILEASLTHPSIRHAIMSLIALRENFEKFASTTARITKPIPSHDVGLQQYCLALKGLASGMSIPLGANETKATLLCCQVFISIEQVREEYAVMAQHIIHALKIMRSSRARPSLDAADRLVPCHHDQLPLVDVFIIKLFATPCGFAERQSRIDAKKSTLPGDNVHLPEQQQVEPSECRRIAPDMRTELMKIAASTLSFLESVSCLDSVHNAFRLQSNRGRLLSSLESWLVKLDDVPTQTASSIGGLVVASFTRLFHRILRIIVLSTLDSSPNLDARLQTEYEHLQAAARNVNEKVKTYRSSAET